VSADGKLDELAELLKAQVPGVTQATQVDSTVQLGVKGTEGVLPAVVNAAEQGGFTVTDLSVTEPTLETVFINLTGKDLRD
jgi:ABC-2 type transport system ATP-binding protein